MEGKKELDVEKALFNVGLLASCFGEADMEARRAVSNIAVWTGAGEHGVYRLWCVTQSAVSSMGVREHMANRKECSRAVYCRRDMTWHAKGKA